MPVVGDTPELVGRLEVVMKRMDELCRELGSMTREMGLLRVESQDILEELAHREKSGQQVP